MRNELVAEDYEAILEVISQFDAIKVAKAMRALDWYWRSADGVPEWWEINMEALKMLKRVAAAATHDAIIHSSGGLWVRGVRVEGKLFLKLKFVLVEADNYEY